MKTVFVYGTVALALSAAPLMAQQPGSSPAQPRQTTPAQPPATHPQPDTAHPAAASRAKAATADHHFVMEAAQGSMAEVELGKLAADKAESDAVKQFGQRMVTDHGKASDELKTLAQSKNITLPTDLGAKHKATKDRLSKLSGAAFDRAYMRDMVSDHQKDVAAFQKEARSGSDPDVKAWAAKTLPTLEEHLQQARAASRTAVGTSGMKDKAAQPNGTAGKSDGTSGKSPATPSAPAPRTAPTPRDSGGTSTTPR